MKEKWKPIENYEGLYEISNLGSVRNVASGELKKPTVHSTGRTTITLYRDNRTTQFRLDRLVATTFVKKFSSKKTDIIHKDGNQANCSSKNLKWVRPNN